MADERCVHELVVGQCTECSPVPPGLTARVLITRGGQVFHRTVHCEALRDGQRKASRRFHQDVHTPQNVPLSVALAEGRGACRPCFPRYRPAHIAKPCQVRVDGVWRDGLLTEWRRDGDGPWSGVVTYVSDDGQSITVIKQEGELRPPQAS